MIDFLRSPLVTVLSISVLFFSCQQQPSAELKMEVYETSSSGNQLTAVTDFKKAENPIMLSLDTSERFQKIVGFGGAFTESSAYLLNQMSEANRNKIIDAYFADSGARYSLTRTHMNSCDFSLDQYSYAPVAGDTLLESFSIEEDKGDIIPMIKDAQQVSSDGFKILSSPWTAPPWMKDNNEWTGGSLKKEYYDTWALFFSKYLTAYQEEGIDIWGFTVENEPLGNGAQWESMHYTPEEMVDFTNNYLGPKLEEDGHDVVIYGYDQNRDHVKEWVDVMYQNDSTAKYFDGTAIHWYASTVDWFPEALNYAHDAAPGKYLTHTEGCVDAEVPHWNEDEWYWKKEATDWGYDWAPEEEKKMHPKYVPVYRYARNIIGSLNNWVDGWIDWNMVLDREGGPNWAKNWCNAPVIVDPEQDEVYFTPLYYTMAHFSKYIRPEAERIGLELSDDSLMATAALNPDGSIAVVILNMGPASKSIQISLGGATKDISIKGEALQTVVIK